MPITPHEYQVQLLYDLAALNGEGRRGQGSNREESEDKQTLLLAATEETTRALTRLADQASTKMSLAATKTDFKEAALWRDRRNALLAAVGQGNEIIKSPRHEADLVL